MLTERKKLGAVLFGFFLIAALGFGLSAEADAQEGAALVEEIAQITNFTGDVLVRNRMEWLQVEEVGHPLFSGDKLTTRKGRAEVTFTDGSVLRLGLDTNIKVSEKSVEKGIIFKRIETERSVRSAIGKVWFDIRDIKGKTTTFKTPTMSAGIRGTTGLLDIDATGVTAAGLSEGTWETVGTFEPPVTMEPPDVGVPAFVLPERTPEAEAHPSQTAVETAVEAQQAVETARSEAETLAAQVETLTETAQAEPTPENLEALATAKAEAGRAAVQVAKQSTVAKRESASEAVTEAVVLNEPPEVIEATRARVEQIDAIVERIDAQVAKIDAVEASVETGVVDLDTIEGMTALTDAVQETAEAFSNGADAVAHVANAASEGDTEAAAEAQTFADNIMEIADTVDVLTADSAVVVEQIAAREVADVTSLVEAVRTTARSTTLASDTAAANAAGAGFASTAETEALARVSGAIESLNDATADVVAGNVDAVRMTAAGETEAAAEVMNRVAVVQTEVSGAAADMAQLNVAAAVPVVLPTLPPVAPPTPTVVEAAPTAEEIAAEETAATNLIDIPVAEIIEAAVQEGQTQAQISSVVETVNVGGAQTTSSALETISEGGTVTEAVSPSSP